MNVKATAKFIRMSPRKTRLVVDLVRGMGVTEARHQLLFSNKLAAKPILKLLDSALANAKNNFSLDTTNFIITKAMVDQGPVMYRYTPRAQGRATPIRKRMSHILIEVGPRAGDKTKAVKKVVAKKPVAKKTVKKTVAKKVTKSKNA